MQSSLSAQLLALYQENTYKSSRSDCYKWRITYGQELGENKLYESFRATMIFAQSVFVGDKGWSTPNEEENDLCTWEKRQC